MFNHAQHNYIAGGSFSVTVNGGEYSLRDLLLGFHITCNYCSGPSPLDTLCTRASPNAILNAGGRADEVRCHPGTREKVLGRIESWRDAHDSQEPPIFWLSGPAGAGKTAIVQTIAERCRAQDVPQANFFFFRTDPSRNSLPPLVATLVHQMILLYPPLRDPVATVLFTNPLILDAILEDQLRELIVIPLQGVQQSSSSYVPPLIIVDGLDECESEDKRSQRRILHAFYNLLTTYPGVFCLLVASRDESQIQAAFNNISSQVLLLYLDESYSPENDIRAFVHDEFKPVLKTHPLAHMLPATWPSFKDIEEIVKKSSGQFVYAATVMRFISDSSASPVLSLARVQGAAAISAKSPFSYLDAIYAYILSQVDDQEALKDILHAHFLIQAASPAVQLVASVDLAHLLQICNPRYTQTTICSCLADLTSIAQYRLNNHRNHTLFFYHASFPDYLLEKSRSGDYCVDLDAFNFKFVTPIWKEYLTKSIQHFLSLNMIALHRLRRLHQFPPDFLDTLLALDPSGFIRLENSYDEVAVVPLIFGYIYKLCSCDDDVNKCKQILRRCIRTWVPAFRIVGESGALYVSPWPQFCFRYLAMAFIDHYVTVEVAQRHRLSNLLLPESDIQVRETATWLNELLHRIHREKYHDNTQKYNVVIRKWVFWATWNNIPLDGVEDLPNVWWYLRQSRIEKWFESRFGLSIRTW